MKAKYLLSDTDDEFIDNPVYRNNVKNIIKLQVTNRQKIVRFSNIFTIESGLLSLLSNSVFF